MKFSYSSSLVSYDSEKISQQLWPEPKPSYLPDQVSAGSAPPSKAIDATVLGFHQPVRQEQYQSENFSRTGKNYFGKVGLLFFASHHTSSYMQMLSRLEESFLSADRNPPWPKTLSILYHKSIKKNSFLRIYEYKSQS